MQANVYGLNGKVKEKVKIPGILLEPVRPDLIQKAFLAEVSLKRQKYGSDPMAGDRSSAHYHGRRGTRQSMMNREMARLKRIHGQGFLNLTARILPNVVKGRKAHPPKVEKNWKLSMNKKERMKALRSAMAATLDKELVLTRGHRIKNLNDFPIILVDDFQKLGKTKDVLDVFRKIGLGEEMERCCVRKVRAGSGKNRGRRYRAKKGPLIVVEKDEGVRRAAGNIHGVDVVSRKEINMNSLAPGSHPGRLTIWVKSAIEGLK